MSFDSHQVANKADLALLELSQLTLSGPRFRIVHRFRRPGTDCDAGEEIAAVYFIYREKEIFVRLPLALRLFFDYLSTHRHLPQSAAQIAAGVKAVSFYVKHTANASGRNRQTRKISRSAIKEYVKPFDVL